ncbi:hypothetical protein PUN28_003223 [Cardiocondyla obscurior]|uniref:Uncharacterized protein n=1 Tax=Cardiocondyla obscurior TaxID=286306 RepID=A0AAW2GNE6_9HYME
MRAPSRQLTSSVRFVSLLAPESLACLRCNVRNKSQIQAVRIECDLFVSFSFIPFYRNVYLPPYCTVIKKKEISKRASFLSKFNKAVLWEGYIAESRSIITTARTWRERRERTIQINYLSGEQSGRRGASVGGY